MSGDLIINCVDAKNLPDFHLFSNASPYVELHVGSHKLKTKPNHHGKENPHWNEELRVPYNPSMQSMSLIFTIKDHNYIESDKFIARVTIPVAMFVGKQVTDQSFDLLNNKDDPSKGTLHLIVKNESWQQQQQPQQQQQQQQQQAPPPQQQQQQQQHQQQQEQERLERERIQQEEQRLAQQQAAMQAEQARLDAEQQALAQQQMAQMNLGEEPPRHHHHHHHHHHQQEFE